MPSDIKRIVFDKNWNNKLLCFRFIIIRPERSVFKAGERLELRIEERHFCYATVTDVKTMTVSEIIDRNYHLLDSALEAKEFLEMLSNAHSKNRWWKGTDTVMKVVFMEKIIQLDIFEQ
jgi:hypothetical protein